MSTTPVDLLPGTPCMTQEPADPFPALGIADLCYNERHVKTKEQKDKIQDQGKRLKADKK